MSKACPCDVFPMSGDSKVPQCTRRQCTKLASRALFCRCGAAFCSETCFIQSWHSEHRRACPSSIEIFKLLDSEVFAPSDSCSSEAVPAANRRGARTGTATAKLCSVALSKTSPVQGTEDVLKENATVGSELLEEASTRNASLATSEKSAEDGQDRVQFKEILGGENPAMKFNPEDFIVCGAPIGSGSYGAVQRVVHRQTSEVFAMKVIPKTKVVDTSMTAYLAQEVRTQLRLQHDNILRLHYYCEDKDNVQLLLEYASGGSLFQFLRQRGKMEQREAARVFADIANALSYLHQEGYVHRDVKPENILLFSCGKAKLADFGWCAEFRDDTMRNTFCGTWDYLSPEMVEGEPHGIAVDVWAIGVLLFEMLMGRPPFAERTQEKSLRRIASADLRLSEEIPKELHDLLTSLLVRSPSARLPLVEALQHQWVLLNTTSHIEEKECPSDADKRETKLGPVKTLGAGKDLEAILRGRRHLNGEFTPVPTPRVDSTVTSSTECKSATSQEVNARFESEQMSFGGLLSQRPELLDENEHLPSLADTAAEFQKVLPDAPPPPSLAPESQVVFTIPPPCEPVKALCQGKDLASILRGRRHLHGEFTPVPTPRVDSALASTTLASEVKASTIPEMNNRCEGEQMSFGGPLTPRPETNFVEPVASSLLAKSVQVTHEAPSKSVSEEAMSPAMVSAQPPCRSAPVHLPRLDLQAVDLAPQLDKPFSTQLKELQSASPSPSPRERTRSGESFGTVSPLPSPLLNELQSSSPSPRRASRESLATPASPMPSPRTVPSARKDISCTATFAPAAFNATANALAAVIAATNKPTTDTTTRSRTEQDNLSVSFSTSDKFETVEHVAAISKSTMQLLDTLGSPGTDAKLEAFSSSEPESSMPMNTSSWKDSQVYDKIRSWVRKDMPTRTSLVNDLDHTLSNTTVDKVGPDTSMYPSPACAPETRDLIEQIKLQMSPIRSDKPKDTLNLARPQPLVVPFRSSLPTVIDADEKDEFSPIENTWSHSAWTDFVVPHALPSASGTEDQKNTPFAEEQKPVTQSCDSSNRLDVGTSHHEMLSQSTSVPSDILTDASVLPPSISGERPEPWKFDLLDYSIAEKSSPSSPRSPTYVDRAMEYDDEEDEISHISIGHSRSEHTLTAIMKPGDADAAGGMMERSRKFQISKGLDESDCSDAEDRAAAAREFAKVALSIPDSKAGARDFAKAASSIQDSKAAAPDFAKVALSYPDSKCENPMRLTHIRRLSEDVASVRACIFDDLDSTCKTLRTLPRLNELEPVMALDFSEDVVTSDIMSSQTQISTIELSKKEATGRSFQQTKLSDQDLLGYMYEDQTVELDELDKSAFLRPLDTREIEFAEA